LVRPEWADEVPAGTTAVVVPDPHAALQLLLSETHPSRAPVPGVHPTAVIAEGARISPQAAIGAFAVIGGGSVVGASEIGAHAVIGENCRIGDGVTIHAHATLYDGVVVGDRSIVHSGARVGKPGFGFVWREGGHRRIPQVGGCVIGEDVEIGANTTI